MYISFENIISMFQPANLTNSREYTIFEAGFFSIITIFANLLTSTRQENEKLAIYCFHDTVLLD